MSNMTIQVTKTIIRLLILSHRNDSGQVSEVLIM